MTAGNSDYLAVDNFIQLACCVEAIDDRIRSAPSHHLWHWNSRRNTAIFLLNRIADQIAVGTQTLELPRLTETQRRKIADNHSLLSEIDANEHHQVQSVWQPDEKLRRLITQLHESP